MAQNVSIIPQRVTSADALDEVITFTDLILSKMESPIILITIVSGTWKFGVGEVASNSSASYTIGDKIPLTLRKGTSKAGLVQLKLNVQAANAGEEFDVTGI